MAQIKELMIKVEKQKAIIAKARDTLRSFYTELEDLVENIDDGLELLQEAVDKFSEQF